MCLFILSPCSVLISKAWQGDAYSAISVTFVNEFEVATTLKYSILHFPDSLNLRA